MDNIDRAAIAAKALGISYGYYQAMIYNSGQKIDPSIPPRKRNRKHRKFTDQEAFTLWQQYLTDKEIAAEIGVSRAYIQRWRDQLELPSTSKTPIDTQKYRLTHLQDGTSIILREDDEV